MPSIGTISGLCADYSQATLNGRPYDRIFERILKGEDFRFNEMMKRGGIPCELGHPVDVDADGNPRTETDPTKVAVILTAVKKAGPGKLVAEGKIADTPNGKIFKELSDIYTFGLSSRGSYEISEEQGFEEGPDGWNQDSYCFKGFDLVILPANPDSMLSVTEGLATSPKRPIRVARESIDVNMLSKATQVSEDQVEEALDQLFAVNPEAKQSEEVPVNEMKEEEVKNPEEESVGEEGEVSPETEEVKEDQPSLIADGDELEKIKADLQTALDEIESLSKSKEEGEVELSNRDAEILKLSSSVEDLQSELDERIKESEEFVEKFETLKEMSAKLLESYKVIKAEYDSRPEADDESANESIAKLEELESEKREAMESLEREKRFSSALRKELASAKESLISAYSMSFGVSMEALKSTLGKNYSVRKIRPAAEALANQTSKYSAIPTLAVAKKRSAATESLKLGDDVEREIYDLINHD